RGQVGGRVVAVARRLAARGDAGKALIVVVAVVDDGVVGVGAFGDVAGVVAEIGERVRAAGDRGELAVGVVAVALGAGAVAHRAALAEAVVGVADVGGGVGVVDRGQPVKPVGAVAGFAVVRVGRGGVAVRVDLAGEVAVGVVGVRPLLAERGGEGR